MTQDTRPYRHLNQDGTWPGFAWTGLELDAGGALRLMPVPRLEGAPPPQLERLASVQPPGGVAIDETGSIYFSDPAHSLVRRIEGCFGQAEAAPCIGAEGSDATQMREPAALVVARHRRALYVADSGNHRVQIFDTDTLALVEILDGFPRPVSIALDEDGNLYVVDTTARRADRFSSAGDLEPAFWEMVHASGRVSDPRAVACERQGGQDLVYLLDGETHHICIFTAQGLVEEAETTIDGAAVFAVADGVLYIGDPARRRIAVLRRGGTGAYEFAGHAAGYEGPVAALASDRSGGLLVSPGCCVAPLRLRIDRGFRPQGWLWSRAIEVGTIPHYWNRLHADVALPVDAHVQFFVHAGPANAPPPSPAADGRFAAPWRAVGDDVTDFFLSFDDASQEALWIGARFANDGQATPVLSQARLDFDQAGYLPQLPAIYREKNWAANAPSLLSPDKGNFLLRYVSLFESFFDEFETRIRDLPALVDPAAAPDDALPWLASFLALSLPDAASEDAQRKAIAGAYARHARRGTVEGLREALRAEAGVRAWIDEPLQAMGWWSMPASSTSCKPGEAGTWVDGGDSILGFNTVLASAEPQGAVVGTTATLDGAQLLAQEDFGTPLFDAVAYRFVVWLYARELACAGKLDLVRAIVEREKPAHTLYELRVIDAGIRIGWQARLGIDTLLGSGPAPGGLGESALGLHGQPRARLGIDSRLGTGRQL
ncbi:phage tail protein [Variovorax sp. RA8]|uniref:phage tail protein n=1 Tax=Variovorax sp. (strain JCM 16519 / RA8) TaxID=662548 RepID=UPI0013195C44|nr:phage tail protein [Variovorax sp. RA8]VTU28775.1 phage tail protein domain protein [Variovorax sp. RA8]